jgi:hypothetical protein
MVSKESLSGWLGYHLDFPQVQRDRILCREYAEKTVRNHELPTLR